MKQQNTLGILAMLLATLFFALMNALVKKLGADISVAQSVFFRSVLVYVFILPLFAFKPLQKKQKGGYLPLLIRSMAGGISMVLFFYNIATIPLGIASAFAQSVPIYAVFFAYFFLKERISLGAIFATLLGFSGLLLISDPQGDIPWVNAVIGVLSGVTAAGALVSVRVCKEYFDERVIILSFSGATLVLSLVMLWVGSYTQIEFLVYRKIDGEVYWWILAMGFFGALGQYFMTKAYILAPAGIVAPIDYVKVVFSLWFGILLGDLVPQTRGLIGMGLVVLSGLLIALPVFIRDFKMARAGARRGDV
ncbi:hypothetical protein BBW65_04985 [Helicobacter enhydrae]|uniref:EamA domain-containing protein n=1 Tax=Helicobacter enhydrae TaxID=222136 RepID=A0A1B1U639_9HELI|nr:DMT family transporter [Helicobacter enhydrae]ANV98191.1 hypothetical protein BBW65_04985 [Helicobacter enhydrae]